MILVGMYLDLVCNQASIETTFDSNHTLLSIDGIYTDALILGNKEVDLYSMLQLNRNEDKRALARRNILRCHTVDHKSFELHVLPHYMVWVGREGSEPSMMYDAVHSFPHMMLLIPFHI